MNYLNEQGLNTYDTLIKSYISRVMTNRSEIPQSLMAVINDIDTNVDTILSNYVTKTDLQNALANMSEQPTLAVDLGLPSGLLWADRNVGAKSPYDRGLYFTWANTVGYGVGTGRSFTSNDYENPGKKCEQITPGLAIYDAATANMGGDWKMPTRAQFSELINNCTWTWGLVNGVTGYTVTGTNGNSIFLPASGIYYTNILDLSGSCGYYWSTDYNSSYGPCRLYLRSDSKGVDYGTKYYGQSIRAVRSPQS